MWEGLLRATGGALRDDKLYWYLIDFKFTQGQWKYCSQSDKPGTLDLKVVDSCGRLRPQREFLTRLEPSEARETLGVFTPMDGNWRRQVQEMISKARKFVEYLRTSRPDCETTWCAFFTALMKSLEYPMEAVCLTGAEWDKVMSPLMGIVLQLCGTAVTVPRDLLFSSLQYQGLGARHPFYQQMMSHGVTLIAETANPNSPSGALFRGVVEDLRREVGLQGEFTDAPWDRLGPVITHTWLTHLLRFAAAHQVLLHDPLPKLLPPRHGDFCLMDFLLESPFTTDELRMLLAWWRQHYDVLYVSDITVASVENLSYDVWMGRPLLRVRPEPTSPRQPPRRSLDLYSSTRLGTAIS
jgi:hypothetical protein